MSCVESVFEEVDEIVEGSKEESVYVGVGGMGCGIGGVKVYSVVGDMNGMCERVYEERGGGVVGVLYMREGEGLDDDVMEVCDLERESMMIVEDEEEMMEEEG